MNEAETRAEHIDPSLKAAGWGVVEGNVPNNRAGLRPQLNFFVLHPEGRCMTRAGGRTGGRKKGGVICRRLQGTELRTTRNPKLLPELEG